MEADINMGQNTLVANLYPIVYRWRDSDPGEKFGSHLGVMLGDPPLNGELLEHSNTDTKVFYWVNTIEDVMGIRPGDEIVDGSICVEIDYEPIRVEETFDV
jgi:hypothetical protein